MPARLLTLALMLTSAELHADALCPDVDGGNGELASIDVEVRLGFVRTRLGQARRHATGWMIGWATVHSGLIATQGILLATSTAPADRVDRYIGMSAAGLGLFTVLVAPPGALIEDLRLERRIRAARPGDDRCALLGEAEHALLRVAKSQRFNRGPFFHGGSFVFNVGIGLLLGLGFGHWETAAVSSFVGIAVGELMFFTQPNRAPEDLAQYRSGALGRSPSRAITSFWVVPNITPQVTSLQIGFGF